MLLVQGSQSTEEYEAKHESSLIYEGGTLSYEPSVYGGKFQDRYHIKTLQVCESSPNLQWLACTALSLLVLIYCLIGAVTLSSCRVLGETLHRSLLAVR